MTLLTQLPPRSDTRGPLLNMRFCLARYHVQRYNEGGRSFESRISEMVASHDKAINTESWGVLLTEKYWPTWSSSAAAASHDAAGVTAPESLASHTHSWPQNFHLH
jgi:hypothetical protein